ncbi:MAG: hypothetical protein KGS72_11215 [Cyanobacteria bacterium REEB67]|nr:hypothetical protein [Cyanobacteria bacterium REEB67]
MKVEYPATPLKVIAKERVITFIKEHVTLAQAVLVAMSLHVAFFPLMWIAGWALPWPKTPVFTTIVEYDLRGWSGWPKMPKAKKIFDIMDPDLNK